MYCSCPVLPCTEKTNLFMALTKEFIRNEVLYLSVNQNALTYTKCFVMVGHTADNTQNVLSLQNRLVLKFWYSHLLSTLYSLLLLGDDQFYFECAKRAG